MVQGARRKRWRRGETGSGTRAHVPNARQIDDVQLVDGMLQSHVKDETVDAVRHVWRDGEFERRRPDRSPTRDEARFEEFALLVGVFGVCVEACPAVKQKAR